VGAASRPSLGYVCVAARWKKRAREGKWGLGFGLAPKLGFCSPKFFTWPSDENGWPPSSGPAGVAQVGGCVILAQAHYSA
jgi:hypothetical protein